MLGLLKNIASAIILGRTSELPYTCFWLFSTEFREGDKRRSGDRKTLRLNDQHLAHTVFVMEMPTVLYVLSHR